MSPAPDGLVSVRFLCTTWPCLVDGLVDGRRPLTNRVRISMLLTQHRMLKLSKTAPTLLLKFRYPVALPFVPGISGGWGEQRGSRRHLYHLRPPGRILHLVNTDFVMEQMDVHTCDDGCLAVCCCCLASPSKPDDVKACCCTSGKAHRKRRIFTPVWSSANDLAEIKVTGAFLFDHSPDEILKAMEQMLEDLGVSV